MPTKSVSETTLFVSCSFLSLIGGCCLSISHLMRVLNMWTAPETISNYFNMIQVDDSNVKSEPPYIGGAFIPDRSFGGLLVSQAVNSFVTVNPGLVPHSVNYKFVAPAKTSIPLQFKLSHFDDGKMTSVFAYQNEKPVGIGHIRYAKKADMLDSSPYLCPDEYGAPEDYPDTVELAQSMEGKMKAVMEELTKFPLEIRPIESPLFPTSDVDRTSIWLRIKPELADAIKPTDGLLVAMFISDFTILQVSSEIYQKSGVRIKSGASLHHSVWIHEAHLDPLAWYLTVVECEVISYGRVRLESYMFNESKKCVLSVVQEGYMQRLPEGRTKL